MKIKSHLQDYVRDSYVGKEEEIKEKYDINTKNEIDCSYGTSPFGQSSEIVKFMSTFDFESTVGYFDPSFSELKDIILNKFSNNFEKDNLFLGHGSFNLIERIIHKLIQPSTMLGYGPQFNEVPTEFIAAGGKYLSIPMSEEKFVIPINDILNSLSENNHAVLYMDNPNNPTGQSLELNQLEEIVEKAESSGTIVLLDEAYADFLPDSNSGMNIVNNYSNLIVIRSLSKAYGLASFRVGYSTMSDEISKIYSQLKVPFEPTLLSGKLGEVALQDEKFIQDVRKKTIESKTQLVGDLKSLGFRILPTNNYVSIFVANKENVNLYDLLAKQKIITEPGSAYGRTFPKFDDSYVRIRIPSGKGKKTYLDMAGELVSRIKEAEL